MLWNIHGERSLYESEWVNLRLVDVEIPDDRRFEHHVVRIPQPAVGVCAHDSERGVLMMWRHRFISDVWGWEIPAGRVDEGESLEEAAVRETIEETGWQPGPLRQILDFRPAIGVSDLRFVVYLAEGASHIGEPTDPSESERVEWLPLDRVEHELRSGTVVDGITIPALLWLLAGLE